MRTILASLMLISLPVFAGELTVTGNGESSAPPDYISVTVDVGSQCYKTVAAANAGNTKLAMEIKKEMDAVVSKDKSSRDEVTVSQGATSPQTITQYDEKTRNNVEVCSGWSASSRVSLKLANLKAWPALQEKLADIIDANTKLEPKERTAASVSGTTPLLYTETAKALEDAALRGALKEARRQANITLEAYECSFGGYKNIQPSSGGQARAYDGARMEAAMAAPAGGGGRGVDLAFGPQWRRASVTLQIEAVNCLK